MGSGSRVLGFRVCGGNGKVHGNGYFFLGYGLRVVSRECMNKKENRGYYLESSVQGCS